MRGNEGRGDIKWSNTKLYRWYIYNFIDGVNVGELEWVFESHSYIERKGFFTVIDLSDLNKGRHNLIIHSNSKYSLKDEFDIGQGFFAGGRKSSFKKEIPFYYYPK